MGKIKKQAIRVLSCIVALSFVISAFAPNTQGLGNSAFAESTYSEKTNVAIKTNQEDFYDKNVVYKLPDTTMPEDDISVIIAMSTDTVMDAYEKAGTTKSLSEYVKTAEAKKVANNVSLKSQSLIKALNNSGVDYTLGEKYDTLLSGFEITIKAEDFDKVNNLLGKDAELIVGEVYEACETIDVVTNEVIVHETGIFDSSMSPYQGDGVVVAVLDSGLDYTHSAFSVDNFNTTTEALTLSKVSEKISQTTAAKTTAGLTGEDVYVNKKVPFAYDYADGDTDVLPINSEHGTHVTGVIAGKDDTITGVAPNAQIAAMKVFSDSQDGARTSWILAALEDCVVLGVDVINMSLGTSCGFTREVDRENVNEVYDKIRDAGISLVVAASNDYNATFSSEKNGSNPLTKHPDSGTVGSPSTYEGALSVASVDGVMTPYLLYNDEVIYFNEASTSDSETKDFVDDILNTLGDDVDSYEFDYVTIPGVGRSSDYPESGDFYAGKIVLVKRGTTTFEDKVRVALKEKGAAGIIIYNNVSGTISMAVGADVGAVCSISQDQGELLAAAGTGKISISRQQVAGPFMSDFSSWGPTSDLKIKPEITAHGGEILSSVPGQGYDRQSGTSMAAPNQAGATALIRQYVKYSGVFGSEEDLTAKEITNIVNQLMMSTADIVKNKNGLAYAVRKQGAGLMNISKAITTASYITTYDVKSKLMDKTKLELGDDKQRLGVYEMKFDINNISNTTVSYDIDAIVMTEGVSTTYTSHDDTTVTMDGYLLEGATTTVTSVTGDGVQEGNSVTVASKKTATVTVKIVLSEEDKQYIDSSFEYGMYVEGFITLGATMGTEVDLSIPMLGFFGDWTEAPIFDEEYYDTHKDEINSGLDVEDKTMADAYATRVLGGLYSDYIATLGTYYFEQNPSATQIAANKDYIAISNQQDGDASTINSIYGIWAGMLRNAKEVNMTVTEDATGKVIFEKTQYNVLKSRSTGGALYQASIDMDFSTLEHNLKNNTKYTVKVTSYIDYGEKEDQKNVRNVFEFPLYIDFEAPVITDVEFRSEYDKATKKTRLYADLNVYDNHYAMGIQTGQIVEENYEETGYNFSLESFDKYITPVYSSFNSTSKVTIELTDHVAQLKNSVGMNYDANGNVEIIQDTNSFVAICYDYALNTATYEIRIPDEILAIHFTEETINLSPNETKDLSTVIEVYPTDSWMEVLEYESSDSSVVSVVNKTLIAKKSGDAVITAVGYDGDGNRVDAYVNVHVLSEGEDGYRGNYTIPSVNKFTISGYKTNKAFYSVSSSERDIGLTGGSYSFGGSYGLSMYPSESVTINYTLDSYFPERTSVVYKSGNTDIATVTDDGTIVAKAEGSTVISVNVMFDGKSTLYSGLVNVSVKDPFTTNGFYLMSYRGLGGEVVIPGDRGITQIYQYAFSSYEYVDKDVSSGDIIDDEDPSMVKPGAIGEGTITKVVIPEGVTHINTHAFANLTALEEVVLPSTLTTIGVGAFSGCTSLKTINLEKVKFINEDAFYGCILNEVDLSSVVAIGNDSFNGCSLKNVILPETSQSLGLRAFANNALLETVTFLAEKIKVGTSVFEGCTALKSIEINSAVIASYAFYGCYSLTEVKLGKDVAVIGEFAFANSGISKFTVDSENTVITAKENGALLYKGTELILAAPTYSGKNGVVTLTDATSIATGAFGENYYITSVVAPNVVNVGAYAFAYCVELSSVTMPKVETIGDYAFMATVLTETPDLSNVVSIGDYAFAGAVDGEGNIYSNYITSVSIPDGATIGSYAFYLNIDLESVEIGNNVTIGEAAFYEPLQIVSFEYILSIDYNYASQYAQYIFEQYYNTYDYTVSGGGESVTYTYYSYNLENGIYSSLTSVKLGDNVVIGNNAFEGNARLTTLQFGENAVIGDYAFFNNASLTEVDLSKVSKIGNYSFSGERTQEYTFENGELSYGFEIEYIGGEFVVVNYSYTSFAPKFTTANLTSLNTLGNGAFANNDALTTVQFKEGSQAPVDENGNKFTKVSDYSFTNCSALTSIALPEYLTEIGDYSFAYTSLNSVDLKNVEVLGEYAFANTKLESVNLKKDSVIADGAFAYAMFLTQVTNLDTAVKLGAYSFTGTALTEVTLTNAIEIGDFAFSMSALTKVTFGDQLESLGENPFYECFITTFAKEEEDTFHGQVVGTKTVNTYDISENVKVIDEVLYQVTKNGGLELISYPLGKTDNIFTVAEGTVRIGARAFEGAVLSSVTLPTTLVTIGDKAFYGCYNLKTVVFLSYEAPLLEEEYSETYQTYENLPFTGSMFGYEGLGITSYYTWSLNATNFFYGANFVDYIGYVTDKLVMVRPSNGQHYDTFILSQYFATTVNGATAALQTTLDVISMIDALPSYISLSNEQAVLSARNAYASLSVEQQALVTNITKLESAESMIAYLKLREDAGSNDVPETPSVDGKKGLPGYAIGLIIGGAVLLLAAGGFVVYYFVFKKKKTVTEEGSVEENTNEDK